jgi:predicted HTH domain antitoxin
MSTQPYEVTVELPAEAFRDRPWSPAEVASDLRLLWLIDQVRRRELGSGKAAELAGVPMAAFLLELGAHHVSAIDLDEDEIDVEIATARGLGKR